MKKWMMAPVLGVSLLLCSCAQSPGASGEYVPDVSRPDTVTVSSKDGSFLAIGTLVSVSEGEYLYEITEEYGVPEGSGPLRYETSGGIEMPSGCAVSVSPGKSIEIHCGETE